MFKESGGKNGNKGGRKIRVGLGQDAGSPGMLILSVGRNGSAIFSCSGLAFGEGFPKVNVGKNGRLGSFRPFGEPDGKFMRILGRNGGVGRSIPAGTGFKGPPKFIRIVGRKGMFGSWTPGVPGFGAENGSAVS